MENATITGRFLKSAISKHIGTHLPNIGKIRLEGVKQGLELPSVFIEEVIMQELPRTPDTSFLQYNMMINYLVDNNKDNVNEQLELNTFNIMNILKHLPIPTKIDDSGNIEEGTIRGYNISRKIEDNIGRIFVRYNVPSALKEVAGYFTTLEVKTTL